MRLEMLQVARLSPRQLGESRDLVAGFLLSKLNPDLRVGLRKNGFMTRDSRMKERKKYGQKGARRRFQYSKR